MDSTNSRFLFTSEAGLGGHPDKIADQISDSILDAYLEQDPFSRVGCQVMVTNDAVMIGGQITSRASIDLVEVARAVIQDIGYIDETKDFNYKTCEILTHVTSQSEPLSKNVSDGGAGDSAIVFGYACTDTKELMPMPYILAHGIAQKLEQYRKQEILPNIGPDGKIQVTVEYHDLKPARVHNIVVSVQHTEGTDLQEMHRQIRERVITEIVPEGLLDENTIYNSRMGVGFTIGGPQEDCGLTGRKVISDTYGGWARNGGGGLSGKDPTKIDRNATYMARYIAKNIVAAHLADRCELQLAYVIGQRTPVSVYIDLFGTGKIPEHEITSAIPTIFPLSPAQIIDVLDLRKPIYRQVGAHGHFGRSDLALAWERTDKVQELRRAFGLLP